MSSWPGIQNRPTNSLKSMMTSSNGNMFRITGPLCGEFTGPGELYSLHKGQWRGALMFSFICAWINDWVNNREAGDLRRHHGHYDVNVMLGSFYHILSALFASISYRSLGLGTTVWCLTISRHSANYRSWGSYFKKLICHSFGSHFYPKATTVGSLSNFSKLISQSWGIIEP